MAKSAGGGGRAGRGGSRASFAQLAASNWNNMGILEQNRWLYRGGREGYIKATVAGFESLSQFANRNG